MTKSVLYSSSPLLASKTPVWRSKFVVATIALAFVGLAARAAYVQVFGNSFFQEQGQVRFARTLELPANRGRILDRNGLILASSVPSPSLWAIPEDVEATKQQLQALAKLLDMPISELNKKLADEDKNFVWLKRQIDDAVAQKITALGIKGIYQRKEYKRQYPEGETAAHLIGFTDIEDQGIAGIEVAYNKELKGRAGSRRVIKDRMGRVVEDTREQIPPVDGQDLQLSIDSKMQFVAYQKLRDAVIANKAVAGSVVMLDAITGEVLAMANYPSYSPDKRHSVSSSQLRNIALTDTFEPGSVMKAFTIGIALESGRVRPETSIQTAPGRIQITGSTISDAHPNGALTVQQVLQKSSNVGTVKLAMQMQPREMWETFSQAGFGQKPQITFPGVVSGRLRPYKTWRPIEQATMSYGYGLSASLFQMARAYTVFGHDGQMISTTLLKSESPAVGVQVFSSKTAAEVRTMLQMAAGPGGTGQKAQTLGYSVGGKSGTAYKQVGKSYGTDKDRKYRGWFVGMAPIDKPRVIVAVMIDEPRAGKYYGGEVAAPVFSELVQQALRMQGVQPDMSVKPQIVTQAVEESF
jgi:cell division protein FtsI (penicillin-binding protein 3)